MLTAAWIKHGSEAFSFSILQFVENPNDLLAREQFWIDHFQSADGVHGYNACPVAGTREGCPQPESVARKMRAVHSGKPKTAEQRRKMSEAAIGRQKTEDHKEKLRQATMRQMANPEAREAAAKFGAMGTGFKGKRHSPEAIAILREKALARYAGKPKAKRKSYYVRKPREEHKKTGPKKGTPRADRRALTDEQVREIRRLKEVGVSYGRLSVLFESDRASLHSIVTRKSYADIV